MVESRRSPRHLTLKTGTIVCLQSGERITCAVLNLSDTGAGLLVASTEKMPASFELILDPDQKRRRCTVAWKSSNRLGVFFTDPDWRQASSSDPDVEAKL